MTHVRYRFRNWLLAQRCHIGIHEPVDIWEQRVKSEYHDGHSHHELRVVLGLGPPDLTRCWYCEKPL